VSHFLNGPLLAILGIISFLKKKNMYYNQSCAAKGKLSGNEGRYSFIRNVQRAPVNIFKTDNSFEMLVFAPGRVKEQFKVALEGNELVVSYSPPEGFPKSDWVRREYSRGGFRRSFIVDETIDGTNISARYESGVLQISLPLLKQTETQKTDIIVQ
jgi:HSP20 family protein